MRDRWRGRRPRRRFSPRARRPATRARRARAAGPEPRTGRPPPRPPRPEAGAALLAHARRAPALRMDELCEYVNEVHGRLAAWGEGQQVAACDHAMVAQLAMSEHNYVLNMLPDCGHVICVGGEQKRRVNATTRARTARITTCIPAPCARRTCPSRAGSPSRSLSDEGTRLSRGKGGFRRWSFPGLTTRLSDGASTPPRTRDDGFLGLCFCNFMTCTCEDGAGSKNTTRFR